jgi:ribosomal protein S18 acetylase RimI-like enzyme
MSLSYTSFQNPAWKDRINLELKNKLESLTNAHCINQPQGLYVQHKARLVGGIIFQKSSDVVWIDAIWVDSEFKRQGIGRSLIDQLLTISKNEAVQVLQLNNAVC